MAVVAVGAWMLYSAVFPAVRAFTGTRGTSSGDLVASLRRARSGTGGGSRMSGVLRLLRDSVVLSVGSTLLMGQYASFTLGEVAESVLNGHSSFSRQYGPVMLVVEGEPDNDFVHIKGTDGQVVDKLPSLVLKGIVVDGRSKPVGQVRLVATYDSLDVQKKRTWGEWAQSKQQSAAQLWAAVRGSKATEGQSSTAQHDEDADFGPEFMRKLKEAVLDMPEFEFTLREMSFTPGEFDPVNKTWAHTQGRSTPLDLTPFVSGQVRRAVDHIPGEHVVQGALAYMGGAGDDEDVRRGLTDIYRSFVQRREEAYARAERERSGNAEPDDDNDDASLYGSRSNGSSGGGRTRSTRGGGAQQSYTRASARGPSGGGTVLDAEFTVRRDDPHAENR